MLIDTCNFCLNGVFSSLSLEHSGCFSSRNVLLLSDTFLETIISWPNVTKSCNFWKFTRVLPFWCDVFSCNASDEMHVNQGSHFRPGVGIWIQYRQSLLILNLFCFILCGYLAVPAFLTRVGSICIWFGQGIHILFKIKLITNDLLLEWGSNELIVTSVYWF